MHIATFDEITLKIMGELTTQKKKRKKVELLNQIS